MNVLHICGNPKPISESASKQLAASFFAKLAELNPDIDVTNVDLYQNPPPYVSNDALRYFWNPIKDPAYKITGTEEKASTYARNQGALLKEADVLVLTMPMWCNSMPAIMKAWLDQVLSPGIVFSWGPDGVSIMHHLRKVILLVASGAVFKEEDPDDGITPVLRSIFSFIGVTDIAVAWADGQDVIHHHDSSERKTMAMEAAQELAEEVAEMVAEPVEQ
ncbi:MAG: hypothetical protein A2X46_06630 [Lentisphaerae bacterium GWF2_57_35]|nr:MAG: hypothetical protein A2X46_06630 [Lentisphaerae bacterium GWF2_57_35]